MDGQDWNPVIVRRGGGAHRHAPSSGSSGRSATSSLIRRLEEDDLPKPTKHLSPESRTEMIRARTAKGWTQTQLNTACAFPLNTIRDIENGKLCPNPTQLNVLSRILGVSMKYAP